MATPRYDPANAKPGREAFRRERIVRYRPGLIIVTHPTPPAPPDDDGDATPFPVWLRHGGGGGSSGAPLSPAPPPGPEASERAGPPSRHAAPSLPCGETRATFPAEPTPSGPPEGPAGSRPKSEACLEAAGPSGEPRASTERPVPSAGGGERRRRSA